MAPLVPRKTRAVVLVFRQLAVCCCLPRSHVLPLSLLSLPFGYIFTCVLGVTRSLWSKPSSGSLLLRFCPLAFHIISRTSVSSLLFYYISKSSQYFCWHSFTLLSVSAFASLSLASQSVGFFTFRSRCPKSRILIEITFTCDKSLFASSLFIHFHSLSISCQYIRCIRLPPQSAVRCLPLAS